MDDELRVQRFSADKDKREVAVADGSGRFTSYTCPHNYSVDATVGGEPVRITMTDGEGVVEQKRHGRPSHTYSYADGGIFCRTHYGLCQMDGAGRDH